MAVALTATLEATKLAAKLDVTGIPAGADTLTISRRSPSGNVATVRGASNVAVSGTVYMIRDWEVPLGLTVTYTVTVYDGVTVVGTASAIFTIAYVDCDAWLVDLVRPTNSLQVTIESLVELAYSTPVGIHRVLDRRDPIVTALPSWTPAAELIVLTDTLDQRDQTRNLLGTGYPFLLRTLPEQGIGNAYFALTEFVEERFLTPGEAAERRFRIACVQVERPDPAIYVPVAPNTYTNLKATYATYTALKAGVASYDALAYTFPPGTSDPIPPWPPDDV